MSDDACTASISINDKLYWCDKKENHIGRHMIRKQGYLTMWEE